MWKFTITREEAIPFREADGITPMQMVQYRVIVSVIQEGDETIEDIENQLDIVFSRNLEKTMQKDPIYTRMKNQLNFLVNKIKEKLPVEARQIILEAKKFK